MVGSESMLVLSVLAPGAFSALIADKLSGGKGGRGFYSLMEWVLYAAIDRFLLDLVLFEETAEELADWPRFVAAFGLALAVGLIASFVKQLEIRTLIEREGPGFLARRSPRTRAVLKGFGKVLAMALILLAVLFPQLSLRYAQNKEAAYKKAVMDTFEGTKDAIWEALREGTTVEDLGDFMVEHLKVRRVAKDQHWLKTGSGNAGAEAVYMVDTQGNLVYFSFRDQTHGTTWSGPTQDEEFLNSFGEWNGGKGYGWTGVKPS